MVERIAASREFHRAGRLRAFLAYVVDRKLAGCPDEITEVLIGHRVFGRPIDYNPGDDSIVRTQARTVRHRLERYFAGEGAQEPVAIEIPRGSYVPFFRLRENLGAIPPPIFPEPGISAPAPHPAVVSSNLLTRRQWIWLGGSAAGISAAAVLRGVLIARASNVARLPAGGELGRVRLQSSDPRLTRAFDRARESAMACVYTGDPVGDWYASARNSGSFCMRDVSHESLGAAVLGLTRHTGNMLRRFAQTVAASRKWCGFWIITKDGFPSSGVYKDDKDFGYCLPANLDLLRACYRQLRWTGDSAYLDRVFSNFYDRAVTSYIAAWDKERSGLMKLGPHWRRLHASYHQDPPQFQTGADLVAAQYAAYLAYAGIQELKGVRGSLSQRMAGDYRAKAAALRDYYNDKWWNPRENRFYSGILPNGSFSAEYVDQCNAYPLWFGIPGSGPKTEVSLDQMEQNRPKYDSTYSYFPEVFYQYGRNDCAYNRLLEIGTPASPGYPLVETAFAVLGAIASGLMGVSPDVPHGTIETLPRLTGAVGWARLSQLPVGRNEIAVEHRGATETIFTNHSGPPVLWKASFSVEERSPNRELRVDNATVQGTSGPRASGKFIVSAVVPVRGGQARSAKLS